MEGAYAPRTSRHERRGVLESTMRFYTTRMHMKQVWKVQVSEKKQKLLWKLTKFYGNIVHVR